MAHAETILNRQDGSQARILVQDFALAGNPHSFAVDVFRRESPLLPWTLCSGPADPQMRTMWEREQVQRISSEALTYVTLPEIRLVMESLKERERAAPPPFTPWLRCSGEDTSYDDGSVSGKVKTSPYEDGMAVAIYEWTSHFPNQGHTVRALNWMRQCSARHIEAHGVGTLDLVNGQPGEAVLYWARMVKKGLVDKVFDDDGVELVVRDDGSIEHAAAPDAPRMRA